ncbi:putative ribonuclease H-like domain-containing protein [Tanacetum coccineum]
MPTIPTQSPFTYPNPNSSASPSFTQDDTFMPEPIQPMPTFTQPAVHTQTNPTGQQYPNNVQSQQFQQFQTATISANNAKFPYLEKEKYEIWAMKMEYWIQNADHNLWRIVQQGNSPKRLGKDAKGNTIVHPPVSLDEHVAVQRENKVRTLLLQALPEDHMPDFHHYDDARDIWMAVKARFGGNEESKKMKKTMLKQQFAEFSVTEEEGLHKGYDRFQKILSQLNQVQARPDNDDINLKFLRALPSSWSQVALALKTRGGLESMSFDDLYNKLRSLELDVRIGHSYGVKVAAAPTHSAFIGTACSGSKPTYSDQQRIVPSVSQTSGRSDNVMECVLHSFVAENEQDQDMIYEDFDQVDQLEMEEMDLKWQMAMLSLRINRFEKKAGRKMNYNNQQPARFDRRKVRCYKCLQLGHFARECNVKTVDDKARYSAFKVTEVKTDEPKALVSVDSMVNWSDHAAENTTGAVEKVYGMMAGLHADSADASDAAAEFAMMGISPKVQNCPLGCDSKINDLNHMYNNLDRLYNDCYIKVQAYQHAVKTLESQKDWYHKTQIALEEKIRVLSANLENTTNTLSYTEKLHDQAQKEKKEWEVKFEATLARFEKWKESSKNLKNLIDSSMSTRTKVGLGFQEYFGVDEVFDLSTPSVFYSDPVEKEVKPLYSTFVKAGEMHAVPPPITGTYMPSPYQSDIEETQVSYGSKSDNNISDTISESNDFVSCDNSDKSSDSETHASCDSSLKTQTKDIPPAVDIQTLPESDVEDPNSTTGSPSFSCSENVKSPRIICNKSGMNNRNVCKNNFVRVKKCFVCGSKLHLIKDCDFYNCVDSVPCKSKAASVPAGSRNSSASVPADGSDPAASRNRPAVNSAGRPKPTERFGHPAGWSKRPAPVSAGSPVSAGWLNPAARPYFRPSSVYFNNMYWIYDPMNKGRWGTAGDPSTDNDIGIVDSGCSRSMTGNKEKLDDFVQVKGGIVKFGGGDGRISGKGTIKTSKLDFENVYYVEELQHFNLFSVHKSVDKNETKIPREIDLYTFHHSDLLTRTRDYLFSSKSILGLNPQDWTERIAHVNLQNNQQSSKGRVSITNPHNKTPYQLLSGKVPQIADEGYLVGYAPNSKAYRVYNLTNKRVEETMNLRFLEDKPNVQGIGHEWYFDLDYLTDSLEELAKLQRQEYEAKDAAARYGYLFSQATAEILCQAEAEIRNHGVSAGSTSASSDPAGSHPAGHFQPAGSYAPADQGNPAASTSVSADLIPVHADESTLPPGQELNSSGFFTSSFIDDDFRATLQISAPAVDVKPVPTKRVKNTIHPSALRLLGDLASLVLTRSRAHKFNYRNKLELLKHLDLIGFLKDAYAKKTTETVHLPARHRHEERHCIMMKGLSGISAGMLRVAFSGEIKEEGDAHQPKGFEDALLPKHFETLESVRTASNSYEAAKGNLKDENDPPVNVNLFSACSRHLSYSTDSHLNAVKKFFMYLKVATKTRIVVPYSSPFKFGSYSDSDYVGSHGDRKSTTGGCQFLGRRLISWQCKKQIIVATYSTEAEYVAAASCCAQVLWIQNQLLDYGFNFMNTKIFIDNQSTICIVKNPVFHQRTKHIEIRHHFIRDANEKNLIQVLKIHTNDNVVDLLTKAFDGPRFEYLVVHIGMVTFSSEQDWFLLVGVYGSVVCDLYVKIGFAGLFNMSSLLVVILFCGRLVSAWLVTYFGWFGLDYPFSMDLNADSCVPATVGYSAGGFISADRVYVPAVCMVSAVA